jgi:plastocyanin
MRQVPRLAAVAALAMLAAACGSSNDNNSSGSGTTTAAAPSASGGGAGGQPEIDIEGFQYTVPASVPPGAMIKVVNKDSVSHTVTSGSTTDRFDSGEVGGNGSGSITAPGSAGSYAIICTFHPNMHGTLIVK